MATPPTFEQLCKRACPIGRTLVRVTKAGQARVILVEVSPRGKVGYLIEPDPDDMYSTWRRCKGDKTTSDGVVIVWAARKYPELMALFMGPPAVTIPL